MLGIAVRVNLCQQIAVIIKGVYGRVVPGIDNGGESVNPITPAGGRGDAVIICYDGILVIRVVCEGLGLGGAVNSLGNDSDITCNITKFHGIGVAVIGRLDHAGYLGSAGDIGEFPVPAVVLADFGQFIAGVIKIGVVPFRVGNR